MKKTFVLGSVVGIFLLMASFSRDPVSGQDKPAPAAPKWEYKVVTKLAKDIGDFRQLTDEAEFNKLGDAGWELSVSVGPTQADPRAGKFLIVTFIFKRPKR